MRWNDVPVKPRVLVSAHSVPSLVLCALLGIQSLGLNASPLVHPNLERGDGNVVHEFSHDRVNAFNGNLRIDIPLGKGYPLSSKFSYRLKLAYNSNSWDFIQNSDGTIMAQPMAGSNAGMGWGLSFGRLIPPDAHGNALNRWIYVSRNGQMNPFYDKLHHDEPAQSVEPGVYYSRNGSYLRLKVSESTAIVETPRGIKKSFTLSSAQGKWLLTNISDPFGNRVKLSHDDTGIAIGDSIGRTHHIYYREDSTGTYPKLIDRVEVAAFGNTTATYRFSYVTRTVTRPGVDDDPETAAQTAVPLLASIDFPDGTSYELTYPTEGISHGRLSAMTLPTLGRIEWEYGNYILPRGAGDCTGGDLPKVLASNRGVSLRRTIDAAGVVEGTWTLSQHSRGTLGDSCYPIVLTQIKTALGDVHRYFFSVATGAATGGDPGLYGQQIDPNTSDGVGRAISQRVYDCASDGTSCTPLRTWSRRYEQDRPANPAAFDGTQVNRREAKQRTIFHDDSRYADINRSDFDGLGHFRVRETRGNFDRANFVQKITDYDAASGTYPGTDWSKPGPGQPWILNTFRQTHVSNNNDSEVVDFCFEKSTGHQLRRRLRLSAAEPTVSDVVIVNLRDGEGFDIEEQYFGGDIQTVGTQADLCATTLSGTPQYRIQHSYQYGALASSRYLDDGGAAFGPPFVDRTIDRNTGLVAQERNKSGVATDVTYDAMGRVTWKKPQPGHGAWERHVHHNASGKGWQGARTDRFWYPNGGGTEVLKRRITYQDGFGRRFIEREWMPGGDDTRTDYRYNAMGWLQKKSEPKFAHESPIKWTRFLQHDPFGRPHIERPPSGAANDVVYEYLGNRVVRRTGQVAVYHNDGNVVREGETTERVYDRQGRLWRTISHGSEISGSPDRVTERIYDVAGRLLKTVQDGRRVGDERSYDGRGFLEERKSRRDRYKITTVDAFGNATEYRRLRGSSTYWLQQTFDHAGRLTEVRSPHHEPYLLKEFIYADSNVGNNRKAGKLWRTKYHHDFAKAADFSSGYPYWQVNKATVNEIFYYGGPGGRISAKRITMSSSKHWEDTTVGFSYDELGNIDEISYPDGNVDDSFHKLDRSRTVRRQHEYGHPVTIEGEYAIGSESPQSETWGTVQYHGNGMVREIAHGNGVTYSTDLDPSGFSRYGAIHTTGAMKYNPGPLGGDYPYELAIENSSYDGEGNLVSINGEYMIPDSPPQYSEPSTPSVGSGSGGCVGADTLIGYVDPLGTQIVYPAPGCTPSVFSMYTASGDLYRMEDFRNSATTRFFWQFQDLEGRPLTEISTYRGEDPQLRDFIYLGNRILATHDRHWDGDRTWHHHPGIGGKNAVTNQDRYRVDIDERLQ